MKIHRKRERFYVSSETESALCINYFIIVNIDVWIQIQTVCSLLQHCQIACFQSKYFHSGILLFLATRLASTQCSRQRCKDRSSSVVYHRLHVLLCLLEYTIFWHQLSIQRPYATTCTDYYHDIYRLLSGHLHAVIRTFTYYT